MFPHDGKYLYLCILALSMLDKDEIYLKFEYDSFYSRVHISSDTAFLKILKKPSVVQE